MGKFLKTLLIITVVAMLGAAIMQIFIPEYNAKRTGFGSAPGWQREIGFWNIAMIVILLGALKSNNRETVRVISYGAFTGGFLFATNHLFEFIKTGKSINLVGAVENYILISLLVLALILDKRKALSDQEKSYDKDLI